MEKLSPTELHEKYGKRIQITFRITENAYDRLRQVAELFGFRNPSQYVKAMLYRELGSASSLNPWICGAAQHGEDTERNEIT
jgi:hypothetical protein